MGRADISVLIPARNELNKVAATIRAVARARSTEARVEFVVVDDSSTDDTVADIVAAVPQLLDEPRIDIRLCALEQRAGNYRCRNQAALMASADVIFMTDAHVEFSEGWDEQVLSQIGPRRILAATITERDEGFRGYGARLLVPLMRTSWNREPVAAPGAVPISVCAGTALTRDLFHKIGGYDPGMLFYGAGEAEFSVRAWLCGAEIHSLPEVEVQHEFKPRPAFLTHMARIRPYWVHNCLRFGLLYLSELGCMQLLRYYARAFPAYFQPALERLEEGDLWARRRQIEQRQERPFAWFVEHFAMKNQMGGEII